MSKKIFAKNEIVILSKNKFLKKVSCKGGTYIDEFKKLFIMENFHDKYSKNVDLI